jgi:hypothetical protein
MGPHLEGTKDMAQPLYTLLFLGCFWLAGSLALQLIRERSADILRALHGRSGLKQIPSVCA